MRKLYNIDGVTPQFISVTKTGLMAFIALCYITDNVFNLVQIIPTIMYTSTSFYALLHTTLHLSYTTLTYTTLNI